MVALGIPNQSLSETDKVEIIDLQSINSTCSMFSIFPKSTHLAAGGLGPDGVSAGQPFGQPDGRAVRAKPHPADPVAARRAVEEEALGHGVLKALEQGAVEEGEFDGVADGPHGRRLAARLCQQHFASQPAATLDGPALLRFTPVRQLNLLVLRRDPEDSRRNDEPLFSGSVEEGTRTMRLLSLKGARGWPACLVNHSLESRAELRKNSKTLPW